MADPIVDACCLINLYASGRVESIIPACRGVFHVSDQVRGESLSIRQPDPDDPSLLVPSPIDLSQAIAGGLIRECRLESPEEVKLFVTFAAQLDEGEASCLAIAKSRGWIVATDDRKAIRLATESAIPVVTTPELVECWAATDNATDEEVVDVLRNIERFARFRPRRTSPLHDWWTGFSDRTV
jgi:hypothetical protein